MPQIGTSSFYLCSKINEKASIMTAKQSKKQELDLLQAVEKIVELAKDSFSWLSNHQNYSFYERYRRIGKKRSYNMLPR